MSGELNEIAKCHAFTLQRATPLSGGDIHAVYLLECSEGDVVIKLNASRGPNHIFKAEVKGLHLLATSNSFKIPEVIATGTWKGQSYILLEHIEIGVKTSRFWHVFAENLAKLHSCTQNQFGLNHNNYIGSLPQDNQFETSFAAFYIQRRLHPQFEIAQKKGFVFKTLDLFYKNIMSELPKECPALVHGDLWSGNYLIATDYSPVLIDPAVAYASREIDLAMMQLFGGFPPQVFAIYNEIYPLEKDWTNRTPIFQLYYLLVHLNIFGSSYLPKVQYILRNFS